MRLIGSVLGAIGIAALVGPTDAQEFQVNKDQLSDLYTGKAYSPFAQRTFPERPLWGDNHLHRGGPAFSTSLQPV
jgi:hypothetical protein